MRADAVMTQARFDRQRLARLLDKALNDDPHPGVRAWAAKAAWQWWVWNPPLRESIQQAWIRKLLAAEPNALVENCFRYQSHALFIANGHKANASEEHQYKELSALFKTLEQRLDDACIARRSSKTAWRGDWSALPRPSTTLRAATAARARWATSHRTAPR